MQVKKILVEIPLNCLETINTISKLYNDKKPININQVAKATNQKWDTVQKQFQNNFNLQGA